MKHYQKIGALALGALLTLSCSNNDDPDGPVNPNVSDVKVQDFVWKGLNSWYFWQSSVPKLGDKAFSSNSDYVNYLNGKKPSDLFYSLLNDYPNTDRFSWIVEDVNELLSGFSGVSKSAGYDFNLYLKDAGNTNVVGIVNYVMPNSPAEKAGIKRGDVLTAVNGAALTVNNYTNLLKDQYSVEIAEKTEVTASGVVTSGTPKTVNISAVVLEENPVAFAQVLNYDNKKIGYLVYNGFQSNYNDELNAAFAKLKAGGATELILDLRYNGGGSVSSAVALGQMITGQFTGSPFVSLKFNDKHSQYNETDKLSDKVPLFNYVNGNNQPAGEEAINSLQLKKVYVLTSSGTASASELTIDGLKPYIDVVTIGGETYGKFVGSITLFDSPSKDYLSYEERNKSHNYAMQPITFSYFNGKNDAHPVKGIVPNYAINPFAYFGKLKEFGNASDPGLNKALELILGKVVAKQASRVDFDRSRAFLNSTKTMKKFGTEMYVQPSEMK